MMYVLLPEDVISIHALVKRATGATRPRRRFPAISIHALVKRATPQFSQCQHKPRHFNPRPREEGDDTENGPKSIGIYFNPRPREEGDITVNFVK